MVAYRHPRLPELRPVPPRPPDDRGLIAVLLDPTVTRAEADTQLRLPPAPAEQVGPLRADRGRPVPTSYRRRWRTLCRPGE